MTREFRCLRLLVASAPALAVATAPGLAADVAGRGAIPRVANPVSE